MDKLDQEYNEIQTLRFQKSRERGESDENRSLYLSFGGMESQRDQCWSSKGSEKEEEGYNDTGGQALGMRRGRGRPDTGDEEGRWSTSTQEGD